MTTTQVATSVTSSESLNADQIIEPLNTIKTVLVQDALFLVAHHRANENPRGVLAVARPNDGVGYRMGPCESAGAIVTVRTLFLWSDLRCLFQAAATKTSDDYQGICRRQPKSPNNPSGNEPTNSEELSGLIN
jgi:hypothetical protein